MYELLQRSPTIPEPQSKDHFFLPIISERRTTPRVRFLCIRLTMFGRNRCLDKGQSRIWVSSHPEVSLPEISAIMPHFGRRRFLSIGGNPLKFFLRCRSELCQRPGLGFVQPALPVPRPGRDREARRDISIIPSRCDSGF